MILSSPKKGEDFYIVPLWRKFSLVGKTFPIDLIIKIRRGKRERRGKSILRFIMALIPVFMFGVQFLSSIKSPSLRALLF